MAFLRKFYGFRGKRKNNSFDGQKILFFDEGEGRGRNLFHKRKIRVKIFFFGDTGGEDEACFSESDASMIKNEKTVSFHGPRLCFILYLRVRVIMISK